MLELKAYVQESIHALDDVQLQTLSETLRIDLRGCDNRVDIERVLVGLLCLDQDTALGTFLAWLRTQQNNHGLATHKNGFQNTFLPISPRPNLVATKHSTASTGTTSTIKEHHLSDEIAMQLQELELMEVDFKAAERQVHHGSPSFEKLKAFMVQLTRLRAKDQQVRDLLIRQNKILHTQHHQIKQEYDSTQSQLAFFVEGFTNLRSRHDVLLAHAIQMKAEQEVAQEVFLSMSVEESHFAGILHQTLLYQLKEKEKLETRLETANRQIQELQNHQEKLKSIIRTVKQEREDGKKNSRLYKRQLQHLKHEKDKSMNQFESLFYQDQMMRLRQSFTNLLQIFRESIVKDTKSTKQIVSKEVLRVIQQLLYNPLNTSSQVNETMMKSVTRVVEKRLETHMDVDEAVHGVVLLGGNDADEAQLCASILCTKFRYVSIDLKQVMNDLQEEFRLELARSLSATCDGGNPATDATALIIENLPSLTIENYSDGVQSHLHRMLDKPGTRGFVLYNWELVPQNIDWLVKMGFQIDSIIELKILPSSAPPTANGVVKVGGGGTTNSKPIAAADPSRNLTTPVSPTKSSTASTRQTPASNRARPRSPDTKKTPVTPMKPKVAPTQRDRKAIFRGMPHLFTQLEPCRFIEERVEQIIYTLTQQRNRKAAPCVMWDEETRQVNESLMMWAQDVHMMLWVEQENRRPKKPDEAIPASITIKPMNSNVVTPPATATSSLETNRSSAKSNSKPSTRESSKATSPTPTRTSRTRASSPAKDTSPTKVKTPISSTKVKPPSSPSSNQQRPSSQSPKRNALKSK